MGLFSKQNQVSNQTSNYNDTSANAGGDDSVALATGSALDASNRSAVSGDGGLSLSNAELTLNTLSDSGAIDLAKELSLASVKLAGDQTKDLKGYVESNQAFSRSIAENALATVSGQPIPKTSNALLIAGAGLIGLILLLVLGRKKSTS